MLILITFFACQKDSLEEINPTTETITSPSQVNKVSLDQAQKAFEKYMTKGAADFRAGEENLGGVDWLDPIWYLGKEVTTFQNTTVSIVPLDLPLEDSNPGFGAQLVFYPHNLCEIAMELVTYQASDSTENAWNAISNKTFTGVLLSFNFCGCTSKAFDIVDGNIIGDLDFDPEFPNPSTLSTEANYRDEPPCWDPNKGWLWKAIKRLLKNIAGYLSSGSAGTSSSGDPYNPPSNTGFPIYNGNTNGDSGDGGSGSISIIDDYFDLEFFEGQGFASKSLLTQMIVDKDLFICAEDLYREVFQCLEANAEIIDPHETNNGLMTIQDFNRELSWQVNGNYSHQCMQDIIADLQSEINIEASNANLVCMASEVKNALGLHSFSEEEVFELIQRDEDCTTVTEVNLDCIKEQLFQWLNEDMDLDDNETCLQTQSQRLIDLSNFYKKHNRSNANACEKNLAAAIGNTFADFYCETGNTTLPLGTYDGSANDALAYLMRERLLKGFEICSSCRKRGIRP